MANNKLKSYDILLLVLTPIVLAAFIATITLAVMTYNKYANTSITIASFGSVQVGEATAKYSPATTITTAEIGIRNESGCDVNTTFVITGIKISYEQNSETVNDVYLLSNYNSLNSQIQKYFADIQIKHGSTVVAQVANGVATSPNYVTIQDTETENIVATFVAPAGNASSLSYQNNTPASGFVTQSNGATLTILYNILVTKAA